LIIISKPARGHKARARPEVGANPGRPQGRAPTMDFYSQRRPAELLIIISKPARGQKACARPEAGAPLRWIFVPAGVPAERKYQWHLAEYFRLK